MPAGPHESFGSNFATMGNFLIDPAGAARRLNNKWFWIAPLIVFSVVSIFASYLILPIARHAMENVPMPANANPEQFQKGIAIGLMIQRIAMYSTPVIGAIFFAIQAAILLGAGAVFSVKARFGQLFNLVAGCSLIQLLSSLAGAVILKSKGEISNLAELRPALGLDIFLPEGTNKVLAAFLGYFTVFEIWWIVMMVLIYSIAFRVTKGKAFGVILPLIVLSLLLRIVGAVFQR